ncbi:DUF3253 domain-containing protein [Marinicauda salina]|uniref:DUF3253 domain-containing protein n=1 Tax=Marinicauda salina TaxID=2135793 RepID=A0A2U2BSU5_9PROT|nr:DUF3253 domain-containing protein [Marinicauda salina]PWE17083.1 DUF3253 domain-containing protein [Marinicauda salina]
MSEDPIQAAILRLVEQRGPEKSIDPAEAAREAFPEDWRDRVRAVRAAAIGLARRGEVVILRKGKPVDPDSFKGVYRIAAPPEASKDGDG